MALGCTCGFDRLHDLDDVFRACDLFVLSTRHFIVLLNMGVLLAIFPGWNPLAVFVSGCLTILNNSVERTTFSFNVLSKARDDDLCLIVE